MNSFALIGIGLKPKHLTIEALEEIKKRKNIFLESYTSLYSEGSIEQLEELIGKKIKKVDREFVESFKILDEENPVLLVFGNPFFATTHHTLLEEAKKRGMEIKIINGISVFDEAIKLLHAYRFGEIVSIPFWYDNYKPKSFAQKIKQNISNNLHTLILLDLDLKHGKFLKLSQACDQLKESGISGKVIVCSCLGGKEEKIQILEIENTKKIKDLEKKLKYPICLIYACPNLNEKEHLKFWNINMEN